MKIVQWEPSCFMRTERQRDRYDESNSEFRSFANAHKNDNSESFEGVSDKLNVIGIKSTHFLQKIHE